MIYQNDICPWNVPARVEKSRFVSLFPEHNELNIQVAPNSVYGVEVEPCPNEDLLFSDMQTSLYSHVAGRLGSGRAGFYRNWYLKGVGRTPLAANWNRNDYLHNSGHLAASSAIREYVVSLYLKGQEGGKSILGCEGILLAELDPKLRAYDGILYGDQPAERIPLVDRHLQAITVKQGGFARPANFMWLLQHISPAYVDQGKSSLGTFCELLAAALTPAEAEEGLSPAEITPSALAALCSRSVQLACEHFSLWFGKGVWWGSFTNNFTIDGRFLDLETPALLGGPCLGYLATAVDDSDTADTLKSGFIGGEVFYFLAQMRVFFGELLRILRGLTSWFDIVEREFAAELADEIERQVFAPQQIIGSRARAIEWMNEMINSEFAGLSSDEQSLVAELVEHLYEKEFGERDLNGRGEDERWRFLEVTGLPWMVTEPGVRWKPYALTSNCGRLLGPTNEQRRQGRILAELIQDLDQTTSLATLLDKLSRLPASL